MTAMDTGLHTLTAGRACDTNVDTGAFATVVEVAEVADAPAADDPLVVAAAACDAALDPDPDPDPAPAPAEPLEPPELALAEPPAEPG
jgi:hypothetical protein